LTALFRTACTSTLRTTKPWSNSCCGHSHQAHPETHLSEQAAEELVDESAYHDKKHSRKSYAHEAGHVLTGLPDP
jgi:isopentenyldiphosphate isomerase